LHRLSETLSALGPSFSSLSSAFLASDLDFSDFLPLQEHPEQPLNWVPPTPPSSSANTTTPAMMIQCFVSIFFLLVG
jgi:hypothetical protein